jgi:hypothetical protein
MHKKKIYIKNIIIKMTTPKKRDTPRWRFVVLSPVTSEIIWTYDAFKVEEVHKKWFSDTKNKFLSHAKAVRACNGELNCPFVKCYKINNWAQHHLKIPDDLVSTSGETDIESGDETEVEEE